MKRDQSSATSHIRSAAIASSQELKDLVNVRDPFASVVTSISKSDRIALLSAEDAREWLKRAEVHAADLFRTLDPVRTVLLLVQSISDFYHGTWNQKPNWAGTALKRSVVLTFKHLYSHRMSSGWSPSKVGEAVTAAAVVEQLEAILWAFEVFGRDRDWAHLSGAGFELSNNLTNRQVEAAEVYAQRGKTFRTLPDSLKALQFQPSRALNAIEEILGGGSPRNQDAFVETLFSGLSDHEPPQFWARVWAYLHLIIRVMQLNIGSVGTWREFMEKNDIVVFARPYFRVTQRSYQDLIDKSADCLFWNSDWYEKRTLSGIIDDMIVERPVVRISSDANLFTSSVPLVMESLNGFIEASLMEYSQLGGVSLSNGTRERLISAPFEREIRDLFRKYGLAVGEVSKDGTWKRGDDLKLKAGTGENIPGQIDVLAFSQERQLVFVAECKVLQGPIRSNQLRNLVKKLGEEDQEKFHSNLRKKIAWLQRTSAFSSIPPQNFVGILVLDNKTLGMKGGEYPVCDRALLEATIRQRLATGAEISG